MELLLSTCRLLIMAVAIIGPALASLRFAARRRSLGKLGDSVSGAPGQAVCFWERCKQRDIKRLICLEGTHSSTNQLALIYH